MEFQIAGGLTEGDHREWGLPMRVLLIEDEPSTAKADETERLKQELRAGAPLFFKVLSQPPK